MASTTFERALPGDLDHFRQSKIALPIATLVSRPRIVACIEEGTGGKLTVLSAPAGWGKSTALAEWSGTTARDVAWLCLDDEDNNPTRFLRGLVSSIERVAPGVLADVLAMLRSPQSVSLERAIDHIVRRLEDHPREIVIVFDHYQMIHNGDIHDGVRLLIDEMPPHLHLAIATRGHLPIPVGRLRAQRHLFSIGIPELRLTVDEARRVLAEHDGIHFSDEDLAALVERTEGWVAGLRLAARSFQAHGDPRAAIARFRGTHQDIADFLAEEVIRQLPPVQRSFLMETAVLKVLTAPVCEAVTERGDAAAMLQEVAKADLFLLPLDEERSAYRYHGLFRDLLTAELERYRPDAIPELNRRASVWYEQQGMMAEAMTHALRADDSGFAVDLLDRSVETLVFECSEIDQVVRWIEQLPRDAISSNVRLGCWYAWTLVLIGRLDQAEFVIEHLEQPGGKHRQDAGGSAGLTEHADLQASIAAIRARIAAYRGDHQGTIVQARLALDLMRSGRPGRITADVMSSLGFAYRALGRTDQAAETFLEAARLGRVFSHASAARWSTRYLVLTRIEQGRLREAETLLEEDLERVHQDPRDPGVSLAALHIGWAEVLIEQNRLVEARDALDPAVPLIQRAGDAKMLMNAYVAEAKLLQAEGKLAEARDRLRRAEDIFPGPNKGAGSAWLALIQGDTVPALRWARTSGFSVDDPADPTRDEHHQIVFARIMARTSFTPEAHALLDRLLASAEAEGRMGRCIELLNVLAVADHQHGDREHARAHLLRALELAKFEGFVRVFVHEGPILATMLRDLARDRRLVDDDLRAYIVELLRAFDRESASRNGNGHANGDGHGLIEPLTERQVEILLLIAEGRSNREIARALFIAEGTVKAHLHQLFGKLMARNRTEAIARARELDLLPGSASAGR
jgi:LuxR family maltose regulon positive regulatory protein